MKTVPITRVVIGLHVLEPALPARPACRPSASPKNPNSPFILPLQELLRLPLPTLEPLLFSLTQSFHGALLDAERFAIRWLCRTLRRSRCEPQRNQQSRRQSAKVNSPLLRAASAALFFILGEYGCLA
jgi:hypothetical protein